MVTRQNRVDRSTLRSFWGNRQRDRSARSRRPTSITQSSPRVGMSVCRGTTRCVPDATAEAVHLVDRQSSFTQMAPGVAPLVIAELRIAEGVTSVHAAPS